MNLVSPVSIAKSNNLTISQLGTNAVGMSPTRLNEPSDSLHFGKNTPEVAETRKTFTTEMNEYKDAIKELNNDNGLNLQEVKEHIESEFKGLKHHYDTTNAADKAALKTLTDGKDNLLKTINDPEILDNNKIEAVSKYQTELDKVENPDGILTRAWDTLTEGFHNTYDGIKDLFTNTNDPGFWHEAFEGGMHAVGTVGVLGIGYLGSILAGKAYTAVTGLFNKNEAKSEANA